MSQSAQDNKTNTNLGFTSVQAYTLAVITLVIGIAVGYFARGSAPTAVAPEVAQSAASPRARVAAQQWERGNCPASAPSSKAQPRRRCWRRPPNRCSPSCKPIPRTSKP